MCKHIVIFCVLLLTINYNQVFAMPGDIVFDPTVVGKIVEQIEQGQRSFELYKQMADSIGKGDYIPKSVSYVKNMFSTCGGSGFIIPSWFPTLNINLCSANKAQNLETLFKWYSVRYFSNDQNKRLTLDEIQEKNQRWGSDSAKIRRYAIANGSLEMQTQSQKEDILKKLQQDINETKNQNETLKINTQINLLVLKELQTLNLNIALLLQVEGYKN